MNNTKKIVVGVLAVAAVIVYFVFMNTVGDRYSGTFSVDGGNWTDISYEVKEGDADQFKAELSGSDKIKVTYNGDYDLLAVITLTDSDNNKQTYNLRVYEGLDSATDTYDIQSEFEPAE